MKARAPNCAAALRSPSTTLFSFQGLTPASCEHSRRKTERTDQIRPDSHLPVKAPYRFAFVRTVLAVIGERMRIAAIVGACVMCAACLATHEPPVVHSQAPVPPLPVSVRVIPEASRYPELDRELCDRVVSDLRAANVFTTVKNCANGGGPVDLTAYASWHTLRQWNDWCSGGQSIGLSLLTAGIVPACSCESGYALHFVVRADDEGVTVRLDREACTLFGWFPLFLNLRSDYHLRGPTDAGLRAEALREQLLKARSDLANLAGLGQQPNPL